MKILSDAYIYFVYDIIMENDGTFRVDRYEATLNHTSKNGAYYERISQITSEYPEDLPTYIAMLRSGVYLSAYEFPNDEKAKGANYLSINPIVNGKLWLEKCKNTKFLEKTYQVKDDVIALYIHYINMINGKESLMCVGKTKYSLKKLEAVCLEGFKSIEDSPLNYMIDDIEPVKGKVYKINGEGTKKR